MFSRSEGEAQRADAAVPTRGGGGAGRTVLVTAMWSGGASSGLEPGLALKEGTQGPRLITMRSQAPLSSHFSLDSNDVWAILQVLEEKEKSRLMVQGQP